MFQKGSRNSGQMGLNTVAFAAIALSLFVIFAPREGRQSAKGRAGEGTVSKLGKLSGQVETSSAILLDSIVSLVQSYYVDSERVTGGQLIAGTMRSLSYAIPALKLVESDSSISISNGTEILEFAVDEEMDYEELLGRLKSLIAFCERIKINELMNKGENIMLGGERDESSIVVNALLSSLDAHSSLMSKDAYEELRHDTEGAFGGLGVLVGVRENVLTVLKPLPRSPAIKLGIQKHDKIISINGQMTFGLGLDKLVGYMRGEPGTVANLVTLRPGGWSPQLLSLKREIIEVDSVQAHEHHDGGLHILRLEVENFASRTAKEITDHIKRFRKKHPIGGIVLDLRGNPGGLLDQAVHVSDIFLDQGIVVTTRGRREETERATKNFNEVNFPLVVLMDEDSASASEIVAGALQDNSRAVVVGQPSFGKGSVQTVFELPEKRALKLTIARYFTPSLKSIQNVGIMPDIWIQPVIKSAANDNLFGPYRYRNEQFLPNHLSAVTSTQFSVRPVIKGYFLKDSVPESEDKADPEMDVAMTLFAKLRDTYGSTFPESARRSSHALALAMPDVKDRLRAMSEKSAKWLKNDILVDWMTDPFRQVEKAALALQIKAPDEGLQARTGNLLEVPWKITNLGSQNAENVSVFVQSPIAGLETKEFLVGKIPAGQTREGKLNVFIPAALSVGRHYVNAGIAIDAQAIPNAQGEFLIEVSDEKRFSLSASVEFVDGARSQKAGQLEPLEAGSLRVVVSNPSSVMAKDVSLKISNLGGAQISIPQTEFKLDQVDGGSSGEIMVRMDGKEKLESSSVVVGLTVSTSSGFDVSNSTAEVLTNMADQSKSASEKMSH